MKRLFTLFSLLLALVLLPTLGTNQTQAVTAQADRDTTQSNSAVSYTDASDIEDTSVMYTQDAAQVDQITGKEGSGNTTRVSVASDGSQGNEGSYDLALSADGRYVAFYSSATNLVAGDNNYIEDVFRHDRLTGQTTLVSVASNGGESDGYSSSPAISADGQYVAFDSSATNLVVSDNNGWPDVFVRHLLTGQTTLVSVSSSGTQGNESSGFPALSTDGRIVVFSSEVNSLVAGDTNGAEDIFVHDRQTGQTTRVSVASDGSQGNSNSSFPALSADGQYVAFTSDANNLVAGDTNGRPDIFVHDRQNGTTTRVSVASDGTEGNGESRFPALSSDGQVVAFSSFASNLIAADTNSREDVFVHDRENGTTTSLSVASDGTQGNGNSGFPALSANGRFVAFSSDANNLVPSDTNGQSDVFVRDRQSGTTTRVSVASDGTQGNNSSLGPTLSADGRLVGFSSLANNLVFGDTNGAWDLFIHDQGELPPDTYVISGRVTDNNSTPIEGVTVSAGSVSATTDSNGDYAITGLVNGEVTVTPTKDGYTFEPESPTVTVQDADVTGVDFVGREILQASLSINYNVGAPGSYFTITGANFGAKQSVSLAINGTELGTVQADQEGGLMFLLTTSNASPGTYSVIATSDSRRSAATIAASTQFMLDTEAPLRPLIGKAEMFDVPAGVAYTEVLYLPVITR